MNPLYRGPPSTVRPQSSISQRSTVNSSVNSSVNGHYHPPNPYLHPASVVHSEAAAYNHGYPQPFYDQPHYPEQPHYPANYNQSYGTPAQFGYDQNYPAEQYPSSYGTNYYEHNPLYPPYPPPKRQRTDMNSSYNQAQYPPVPPYGALDRSSGHPFAAIPRPPPPDGLPVPIPGVSIPQTPHAHPGIGYPHNPNYPQPSYHQQYPAPAYPTFHAAPQPTLSHVPQTYQQGANRGGRYQHGPSTRTWHAPKPTANSTAGSQTVANATVPTATVLPSAQAASSANQPPALRASSVPQHMNALPSVPLPKASPVSGITTVPAQSGQQERSAPRAQAAAAAATQNLSEEEYIKFIQQYEHYEYHDPIAERLLGDNRSTPEPYYSPYDPEQPEVEVDVEDNLCRAKEIVWKPAHSVQRALLSDHWSIAEKSTLAVSAIGEELSKSNKTSDRSISRHAELQELLGRMLSATEMPDWLAMKSDPVFADIAVDGALISLQDVISRRARKARSIHEMEDVDEDDAEEGEIRRSVGKGGWHLGPRLEPRHSHISQISPHTLAKPSPLQENEFAVSAPSRPPTPLEDVVVKAEGAVDNDAMSVDCEDDEMTSNKADDGLVSITEDAMSEMYSPPPPQLSSPRTGSPPLHEAEAQISDIMITIEEPTEIEPPQDAVVNTIEQDHAQIKPNVVIAELKRPGAGSSTMTHQLPPKPVTYVRDDRQEERLARLGVSGVPKPVFTTPGPVRRSRSNSPEKVSFTGSQHNPGLLRAQVPPPPPPPVVPSPQLGLQVVDEYDVWRTNGVHGSPRSVTSGRTIAGSDFHDDPLLELEAQNAATTSKDDGKGDDAVSPPVTRATTRKRGRADSQDREDKVVRQHDDTTPRFRARQPKVDPAYGRRW